MKENIGPLTSTLTQGNVDDRTVVEYLYANLKNGYLLIMDLLAKLAISLANQGLELIIKIRSNMKEKVIHPIKFPLLNKGNIIETING